jgi:two-component system, OmpR family, phosphate regulon response regulator PhoB
MGARILLVEDHATMRGAMRLILEGEGFAVEEAVDGRDALDRMRDAPPRLVFLDLNIPGVPGIEVLQAFKADPSTAGIPVVIVTAEGEEGRASAMRLGADAYLTKPFSPRALLQTIERALGGSGPSATSP